MLSLLVYSFTNKIVDAVYKYKIYKVFFKIKKPISTVRVHASFRSNLSFSQMMYVDPFLLYYRVVILGPYLIA